MIKIQFFENDEAEEVLYYKETISSSDDSQERFYQWNLIELLEALYRMSVNDSIKLSIYHTYSMREILRKLIFNGNEIEREFSLRLLYQLCFDDEIAQDVAKQSDLVEFMTSQANANLRRKRISKNCVGILWILQKFGQENQLRDLNITDENKREDIHSSSTMTELPEKKKHIMISYNRESRELCLDIKNHLQEMGYSVWIDVEDIRGSSLESMADAIEVF